MTRVFISGPMGSGKSTVARALAKQLGLPFHDLDGRVEQNAGISIRELFASEGEAAFRRLERDELERVIESDTASVTALGGGTVVDERCRSRVLEAGLVITLMAPVDVLVQRVARDEGRPLLAGRDAKSVLSELLRSRAAAYAESHGVIDADRPVDEIVEAVLSLVERNPLCVALGVRSYPVEIGSGVLGRLGIIVDSLSASDPLFVVTDDNVSTHWAGRMEDELGSRRAVTVVLPAGEEHKNIATVTTLWDRALQAGLDRRGLVIGFGGGVVGDMSAFAASTLLRGIRLIQIPTTLLAMVDASVGGKTGFDHPSGKNLIGSFHQPCAVLADIDVLSTLPPRERRAGIAEVIKSAWLDSEDAVAALEADLDGLVLGDPGATVRTIRAAIDFKARVVANDERESGARRILNLGHTLGHAIEVANGYDTYLHGEAVALGLVAAIRVGRGVSSISEDAATRLVGLLERAGLPSNLDDVINDTVFAALSSDKKRVGAQVHFVVPGEPGKTEILPLSADRIHALVRAR